LAALSALKQSNVLQLLTDFQPTLVGTIPLDIDIPGSDLDILCEVYDFAHFASLLQQHFSHIPDFQEKEKELNEIPSHITRFTFHSFMFEIVAQPLPITDQRAYRHMLAEAHLLDQGGKSAREAIRMLKLSGMKTEPAFGVYFRLDGDPFQALLDLENLLCFQSLIPNHPL
jgi:hypothetical protein